MNICRDALAKADTNPYSDPKSNALLDCSEAALLAGDSAQALAWAGQAKSLSHSAGQAESEWRASALMALAGAKGAAAEAALALARLKQQWGEADYNRYLLRPDVHTLTSQMLKLEPKP